MSPRSITCLQVSMPFQGHWTSPTLWATHNDREGWVPTTLYGKGTKLTGVAPAKLHEKPADVRWWLEWQAPKGEVA